MRGRWRYAAIERRRAEHGPTCRGGRSAALASGSLAGGCGSASYSATSSLPFASASKWLYAAYVVQKQAGTLSASDLKFLNFTSGYTTFSGCPALQNVDACVSYESNGVYTAASDGRFSDGGAHMEKHASLTGLGSLTNAPLAAELRTQLGSDVGLSYLEPQLAGGGVSTPADYARFLRKLLDGTLRIGSVLGTNAVCTNPTTCAQALSTPIPASESWHYSLGHWVEDDPVVGDGAFSSPGLFGFYPWIDAGRSYYGVLARTVTNGYYESV